MWAIQNLSFHQKLNIHKSTVLHWLDRVCKQDLSFHKALQEKKNKMAGIISCLMQEAEIMDVFLEFCRD